MMIRAIIGLFMCFSFYAVAGQADDVPKDTTVVAQVDGDKLTVTDLEQKEAGMLLQARYKYYKAQREALDQLIDDHLLAMQARREHLTVEQLLERESDSKVKDPTEDQLQVYYEGVDTNEPYATARGKILEAIRQRRRSKLRAAYINTLRSQASIVVSLEPPYTQVDLDKSVILGSREAPLTLIEFADYECPYCRKVEPDIKRLQAEFGNKLAVAFKDFPLAMHPHAQKAAEAARCAQAQGHFWEFHDVLFTDGRKPEIALLKEHARTLHLDTARFDKCLDSGEEAPEVQNDFDEGQRLGLTGTPSFFINGHFFSGAVDYATLRALLEQQLAATVATAKQTASR